MTPAERNIMDYFSHLIGEGSVSIRHSDVNRPVINGRELSDDAIASWVLGEHNSISRIIDSESLEAFRRTDAELVAWLSRSLVDRLVDNPDDENFRIRQFVYDHYIAPNTNDNIFDFDALIDTSVYPFLFEGYSSLGIGLSEQLRPLALARTREVLDLHLQIQRRYVVPRAPRPVPFRNNERLNIAGEFLSEFLPNRPSPREVEFLTVPPPRQVSLTQRSLNQQWIREMTTPSFDPFSGMIRGMLEGRMSGLEEDFIIVTTGGTGGRNNTVGIGSRNR